MEMQQCGFENFCSVIENFRDVFFEGFSENFYYHGWFVSLKNVRIKIIFNI
jgi:hypothetical protein